MPDAISNLAALRWRGLTAPCELAPYDFKHSLPERSYPYINGQGHDWTGRDSLVVQARLHFVNGLFDEIVWYPGEWHIWRDALFDGTAGPLEHPDLGEFNAHIQSGKVTLEARNRGGVVVDVTIVETVSDPEATSQFTTAPVDPGSTAEAVDQAMADAAVPYPASLTGDGLGSFLEAWESIKGQVLSAQLRVTGLVNRFEGYISDCLDDIEATNDVLQNPLKDLLTKLWGSLEAFKDQAERQLERSTATILTTSVTTIDGLATQTKNTVDEIIELNLSLVSRATIDPGTLVRYYTGATTLRSPF